MWFTAMVKIGYGTGAGYCGAQAGRYTTITGVAMCRSPKAAQRMARQMANRQLPQLAVVPGSVDWYWMPVLEFRSLTRDGVELYREMD